MESNTRRIQTTIRHNREIHEVQNNKPVILSLRFVYEKNQHLFPNLSTKWKNTTVNDLKIIQAN